MPLTTRLAYILLVGMLLAVVLVKAVPAPGNEQAAPPNPPDRVDAAGPAPTRPPPADAADFSLSLSQPADLPQARDPQQRLQSEIVNTLLDARPIVAVLRLDLGRITPDIRRRALKQISETTVAGEPQTRLELLQAADSMLRTFDDLPKQGVGLVWILFCGPDLAGNEPQPIWVVEPRQDAFSDSRLKRLERLAAERQFEDFPLPENPARIWIPTERAPILTPRDPEHGQRFREQFAQAGDAPITLILRPDHLLRDHLARRDFSQIPPERRQAALWLQAALQARQQTWGVTLSPAPEFRIELEFETTSQARDFALQAASLARAAPTPAKPASEAQLSPMEWVHRFASLAWQADRKQVHAKLTR